MKRWRLTLLWLVAAGCARCGKPATPGELSRTSGGDSVPAAERRPATVDAGPPAPPAPYIRQVKKLAPLPRQARIAQIFIGDNQSRMPWNPPRARKRSVAEAKAEAEKIIAELRRGGDFEALAKQDSDWPLAAREGGYLGIVTEGESGMLPIVDPAVFAMPVGEVGAPFESPMGFHVLKKLPMLHVAHLFLAVRDGKNGIPARTRDEARALAASVATQLAAGKSFETLVFELSDDLGSAGRGGDLGGIDERTAIAAEVRAAAQALQPGQVSAAVEIPQGFEIIKRLE